MGYLSFNRLAIVKCEQNDMELLIKHINLNPLPFCEILVWKTADKDMTELSKKFPAIVFAIFTAGEDDSVTYQYYMDGHKSHYRIIRIPIEVMEKLEELDDEDTSSDKSFELKDNLCKDKIKDIGLINLSGIVKNKSSNHTDGQSKKKTKIVIESDDDEEEKNFPIVDITDRSHDKLHYSMKLVNQNEIKGYYPLQSNTQIKILIIKYKEWTVNVFSKNLRMYLNETEVKNIMLGIEEDYLDIDIYNLFRDEMIIKNNNFLERSEAPQSEENDKRGNGRVKDIFSFYSNQFKNINDFKYLDLGGDDGAITEAIGNHLGISKTQTICADVNTWYDKPDQNKNVTYVSLTEGKELPFKENEFSLITCFQSLHHINESQQQETINQLYKVLKKGGVVIIREHDCNSDEMRMLIDIEHAIFELVLKDPLTDVAINFFNTYKAWYKNKMEWSKLFENAGFKYVHKRYSGNQGKYNPTRYYYAMYVK